MSKMRDAFEKWWDAFAAQHGLDLTMDEDVWGRPIYKHSHVAAIYDGAFAGYQAAIAAVKEGGAHAVLQVGSNPRFIDCIHRGVALPADQFLWPEDARMPSLTLVPLYKLPEDLL